MGPIIRKSNLNICFLKLCRFVLGDLEFILSELKPNILLIVQMLWTGRSAQQLGCQRARSRAPLGLFPALTPRSGFLLIPRPEAAGVWVVGSLPSTWETWAIFLWFLPWTSVAVRETLGGRLRNQHIGACFQSLSLK